MLRRLHIAGLAGLVALTGCMSTSGGGKPRVSAAQAVAVFQKTCMAAPYNARANWKAFARKPGWAAKGEPIKVSGIESQGFESTQSAIHGSASILRGNGSCSVTFSPADSGSKEAINASVMLYALTGAKDVSGRKRSGMINMDYKGGKAVVSLDRKTGRVSLSLIKI